MRCWILLDLPSLEGCPLTPYLHLWEDEDD